MPTWPVSIPQKPVKGSWSRQPQTNVVGFMPDVGPPIQRRRSSVKTFSASGSFVMTQTQVNTFETFFQDDLEDGSLSFDWDHPETDAATSWRVLSYDVSDIGADKRRVQVEFIQMP